MKTINKLNKLIEDYQKKIGSLPDFKYKKQNLLFEVRKGCYIWTGFWSEQETARAFQSYLTFLSHHYSSLSPQCKTTGADNEVMDEKETSSLLSKKDSEETSKKEETLSSEVSKSPEEGGKEQEGSSSCGSDTTIPSMGEKCSSPDGTLGDEHDTSITYEQSDTSSSDVPKLESPTGEGVEDDVNFVLSSMEQSSPVSCENSQESAPQDRNIKIGRFLCSSVSPKNSFGGVYGSLSNTSINPVLLKKYRNIFSLLRIDCGARDYSSRYDWEKFITRLKTYQSYLKARKEEIGEGEILLLVDVSGSCAGFCDKTLAVAKTLRKLGENIHIIEHSNGFVGNEENRRKEIIEYIKRNNINVVIALGDWDAEDVYSEISQMPQVYALFWLDNYACNYTNPKLIYKCGKPYEKTVFYIQNLNKKRHPKTYYVIGCKEAEDFCQGIMLSIKNFTKGG